LTFLTVHSLIYQMVEAQKNEAPSAMNPLEELSTFLTQRREREAKGAAGHIIEIDGKDAAICLHCKNPFSPEDGVITDDAAICFTCL